MESWILFKLVCSMQWVMGMFLSVSLKFSTLTGNQPTLAYLLPALPAVAVFKVQMHLCEMLCEPVCEMSIEYHVH